MGSKVVLRKGDTEGGVRWEVKFGVPLAPIFDNGDVDRGGRAGSVDF